MGGDNSRPINELELRQHYTKDSLWIKINDNVYDVTKFQEKHPGGAIALQSLAGQDATQDFKRVGHSEKALQLSQQFLIGKFQELKNTKEKEVLKVLQEKEKMIEELKTSGSSDSSITYKFHKTNKIDQKPKYKTTGIYVNDFGKSFQGALDALSDMDNITKKLLISEESKHENVVEAEHAILATYPIYKYKLNKLLKLKYENKKDEFSFFECAEEKSSIIMARGADNFAQKLALCKQNCFEYSREEQLRKIKITYYQEEPSIIITYDNDGVIKTSENHAELIGLDILQYIAATMYGDISFVTYNSKNELVYFFESELIQRIPLKNKYVGLKFLSWHERSKHFAHVLPQLLKNLMECWAKKKIDIFLTELRNRETYQHKFFKDLKIKRAQRDHYFGAFDENDKFIGIMLYAYVYFHDQEQFQLPFEGGEFYKWTSPQEFLNSFEVIPFAKI